MNAIENLEMKELDKLARKLKRRSFKRKEKARGSVN